MSIEQEIQMGVRPKRKRGNECEKCDEEGERERTELQVNWQSESKCSFLPLNFAGKGSGAGTWSSPHSLLCLPPASLAIV